MQNNVNKKIRKLNKAEKDEIKELEEKYKENEDNYEEYLKTRTINGKKIPLNKEYIYSNGFMNKRLFIINQINKIERKPIDEYYIKKINDAYKRKEIDEETKVKLIIGVENTGNDELDLYYYQKDMPTEYDYEKAQKEIKQNKPKSKPKLKNDLSNKIDENINKYNKIDEETKKTNKDIMDKYKSLNEENINLSKYNKIYEDIKKNTKKDEYIKQQNKDIEDEYKSLKKENIYLNRKSKIGNIMNARSDLKLNKNNKFTVDTMINIRNGLDKKTKTALKQSIISELEKKISGSGIINNNLGVNNEDLRTIYYKGMLIKKNR